MHVPARAPSLCRQVHRDGHRNLSCQSMSGRGRGGSRPSPDFGAGDGLLLGGNNAPSRPPQKLVLPGKGGPGGGGGRLFIPDKGMEKIVAQGAEALGPEVVTPTGPNRYRPPAGFMNEDGPTEHAELAALSHDEMLNKLRSRAGRWHQLAKLLPLLNQAGFDNSSVDELTGITPVLQNRWMVAATVYDSLVDSGKLSAEMISRFDRGGEDLLYPFRFLNQEMRVEAAEYIIKQSLDGPACEILARAMKEWERRPVERQGFSNRPGDCMSFKYLRDALECRKIEDGEVKLAQALEAAVTEGARARVLEARDVLRETGISSVTVDEGPTGLASLTILRLDPEELGYRPIPVLGALGQAAMSDLETAPRTSQEGAFGVFSIEGAGVGCKWACLPQWKALAMMRHPVAITLADCSQVPALVTGTKSKTDDDKRRLVGPGLVVADKIETRGSNLDGTSYYLAADEKGRLHLLEGAQVQARGWAAVATVVFVARPPVREQPAAGAENFLQL